MTDGTMAISKVGLVGVGGFGQVMLRYIGRLQRQGRLELAAVCDIRLEEHDASLRAEPFGDLRRYRDYDTFLQAEQALDAVIIATPLPLHADMAVKAMAAGHNVLLEKPPALTVQDIDGMLAVQARTGRVCAVGFQHTSAGSFREFADRLRQGKIGSIVSIAAAGLWKRTRGYFTRSPWVGKLIHNGNYVLDGTVNNPFSHLLMNCLVLAALPSGGRAAPERVQAELYSANDIDSEDTSCLRVDMDNGTEIFFCASICGPADRVPFIAVDGSGGRGLWDYDGRIRLWDAQGRLTEEVRVACDPREDHLLNFADFLQGRTDRLSCPLEDTRKFVLTANLAFESARTIGKIPEDHCERRDAQGERVAELRHADHFVCIRDIDEIIPRAIAGKRLFSQLDVEWATGTQPVRSEGYREFRLFK